MAYLEITPIKCTQMSTVAAGENTTAAPAYSSVYGVDTRTGNGYGAYLKTTGMDPTRLLFGISRNSSECSSVGYVDVVAGSTLGALDYQAGSYSTLNNFRILMYKSTNMKDKGSTGDGAWNVQYFRIPDTVRFLDSNQYLKFRFSATLSASANTSHGSKIRAILLPA